MGFLYIASCHLQIETILLIPYIWMPFIYFSCLIAMARTSSTMLNKNDESGHPCLVPNFRGKAVSDCEFYSAQVMQILFCILWMMTLCQELCSSSRSVRSIQKWPLRYSTQGCTFPLDAESLTDSAPDRFCPFPGCWYSPTGVNSSH